MNFIAAVQHATIGYGIRRKRWSDKSILALGPDGHSFEWLESTTPDPVKLLGPDLTYDLTPDDIMAEDWETV